MKFYNVSHLEVALQRWEEFNLLMELLISFQEKEVSLKGYLFKSASCWREFRKFLLSEKNISWEVFKEKFIFPEESFLRSEENRRRFWIDLVCTITKWTEESRSVFFIEEDLQMLLMETSLGNITWADLKFPFDSFVVNLGTPMLICGGRKSSSVMITRYSEGYDNKDAIELRFFDDELKLAFTPYEKEIIEEYLKNKNTSKISLLADKIEKAIFGLKTEESASTAVLLIAPNIRETRITTSLADLFRISGVDEASGGNHKAECVDKHISFFNKSLHIVLGFCLYLQTIPNLNSKKNEKVGNDNLEWIDLPKKSKLGNNAITDISKICSVGNKHLLKENECEKRTISEIKKNHVSGSEKSPHFRRGTWCRKKGTGNNPEAPRIIWRRPTMVRPDKLQQNSLPVGQRIVVG